MNFYDDNLFYGFMFFLFVFFAATLGGDYLNRR